MDICEKKILKDYYSAIYRLIGVNIDFVTPGGETFRLCEHRNINGFCQLMNSSVMGKKACQDCDSDAIKKAMTDRKGIIYRCHAGFTEITVPLYLNKNFIGCLTSGQILSSHPTKEGFDRIRKNLTGFGVDLKKLKKHYFSTRVLSTARIKALMELISLIGNYIVESENKIFFLSQINERDKISSARQYVEKRYQQKFTVSDVASYVYLSPSHFSHLFKKETGLSFVQYLNTYRVEKAEELLTNTDLDITEIAAKVGFQSIPHFNRIFRKISKSSPREYRNSKAG
jgi:AraC-like DNA-binding protein/ligand-binding sensor protein